MDVNMVNILKITLNKINQATESKLVIQDLSSIWEIDSYLHIIIVS